MSYQKPMHEVDESKYEREQREAELNNTVFQKLMELIKTADLEREYRGDSTTYTYTVNGHTSIWINSGAVRVVYKGNFITNFRTKDELSVEYNYAKRLERALIERYDEIKQKEKESILQEFLALQPKGDETK